MADFEKTEFEFPDEKEVNLRACGRVEEPDPEIEIIHDTPVEDRNRRPMAEPPKEFNDDELTKYDESVQKRIKHFTKGYHEERRAKESAQREKDEAFRYAQSLLVENEKLKGSVNQNQTALLEQAKKNIEKDIEEAKRNYKDAYESGDSERLVNAQETLTNIKIKADKINNFRPAPLQDNINPVQTESQPRQAAPVDDKLLAWQEKNQWFGANKRMTAYALALHDELQEKGVPAGSAEYYRSIDSDIRSRFSDQFGADESVDAKPQRTKSNNVAPATRSTAPKKIVLSQSQVNLAKRLGLTNKQYAAAVDAEQRK